MLQKSYPYYLANEAVAANTDLEVTDKFSGEVATRVAMADAKAIDQAIGAAVAALPALRAFPPFKLGRMNDRSPQIRDLLALRPSGSGGEALYARSATLSRRRWWH